MKQFQDSLPKIYSPTERISQNQAAMVLLLGNSLGESTRHLDGETHSLYNLRRRKSYGTPGKGGSHDYQRANL
jgi:hypothetical protein